MKSFFRAFAAILAAWIVVAIPVAMVAFLVIGQTWPEAFETATDANGNKYPKFIGAADHPAFFLELGVGSVAMIAAGAVLALIDRAHARRNAVIAVVLMALGSLPMFFSELYDTIPMWVTVAKTISPALLLLPTAWRMQRSGKAAEEFPPL